MPIFKCLSLQPCLIDLTTGQLKKNKIMKDSIGSISAEGCMALLSSRGWKTGVQVSHHDSRPNQAAPRALLRASSRSAPLLALQCSVHPLSTSIRVSLSVLCVSHRLPLPRLLLAVKQVVEVSGGVSAVLALCSQL